MKEDLHLYGNELNYFTTFFKYVIYIAFLYIVNANGS